ncbi:hypothetical protein [Azonexus hydrophilus]|uniref:hypothetical protein n=1 Tax=Azonexus hydrophilus TaxID=418702 RepID=UPI00196452DC|nr:hypothetical protein [Azonexus hydrophilus]
MYVWKFDEDQRVFREIPEAEMNADRDGIYVTRRARHAAEWIVCEAGIERPFPEGGLNVAGVAFGRNDFIPASPPRSSDEELAELRHEMRRSGLRAKERLRQRTRETTEAELPLPLPFYVSKGDDDGLCQSQKLPGLLARMRRWFGGYS